MGPEEFEVSLEDSRERSDGDWKMGGILFAIVISAGIWYVVISEVLQALRNWGVVK